MTDCGGFIDCRIGSAAPIHLKRCRAKPAHDELAVAISRAIEIILLVSSQIIACDHDAVRMRVRHEGHELRLAEVCRHGVIA